MAGGGERGDGEDQYSSGVSTELSAEERKENLFLVFLLRSPAETEESQAANAVSRACPGFQAASTGQTGVSETVSGF